MPSEGCREGCCSHPVLSSVLQQGLKGKMWIGSFQQRDCFTWAEFSWPKNLAYLLHMSFSRWDFSCSRVQIGCRADRATSAWQRLEDPTSFPFILQAFLSQKLTFWTITGFWLLENKRIESMRNNSRCPVRVQVFSVSVGLGKKNFLNMVDTKMPSWRHISVFLIHTTET